MTGVNWSFKMASFIMKTLQENPNQTRITFGSSLKTSFPLFFLRHSSTQSTVPPHSSLNHSDLARLQEFVDQSKRLFVLGGAGVSTESGIKDYRSEKVGLFATSDQRPVNYVDFLKNPKVRQRYWARNTTAWPIFESFQPNSAHRCLATLEHLGKIHWLVTQNVDNLHHKAGTRLLTELHGTVFSVICLKCHLKLSREEVQEYIYRINSGWSAVPQGFAPDADVFVSQEAVESFNTPHCERCGGKEGILKPDVVFFGDNVPRSRVDLISKRVSESDAFMIIGSSVETYSALRHVKEAKEKGLPVLILNIGSTRADPLADVIIRARCGEALDTLLNKML